ncbi:MAG: menaquinone biosynthesis decarboxylase, partial [Candidatus Binatia bacterium]
MSTPQITDLRSYLEALEQAGELSRVKVSVSLDQEIGAICLRNLRDSGPGLLFECPGDGNFPLAVDLMASRPRYAIALGVKPEELAG